MCDGASGGARLGWTVSGLWPVHLSAVVLDVRLRSQSSLTVTVFCGVSALLTKSIITHCTDMAQGISTVVWVPRCVYAWLFVEVWAWNNPVVFRAHTPQPCQAHAFRRKQGVVTPGGITLLNIVETHLGPVPYRWPCEERCVLSNLAQVIQHSLGWLVILYHGRKHPCKATYILRESHEPFTFFNHCTHVRWKTVSRAYSIRKSERPTCWITKRVILLRQGCVRMCTNLWPPNNVTRSYTA